MCRFYGLTKITVLSFESSMNLTVIILESVGSPLNRWNVMGGNSVKTQLGVYLKSVISKLERKSHQRESA